MGEKEDLLASLREQRQALIEKLEGLTEAQACRVVVPSGWSPLDMANHVRRGEQYWIEVMMRDAEVDFDPDDVRGTWTTPAGLTMSVAVELYRDQCRSSDKFVLEAPSLEMAPARLPNWEVAWHWAQSLRTVLLHLIDETARHAGHMDIAREILEDSVGSN